MTDSAIVMIRCNTELDSDVTVAFGTMGQTVSGTVSNDTDFTVSLLLDGLTSATTYDCTATCSSGGVDVTSVTGSFTTLAGADVEKASSFVWVADLAGQGWGRYVQAVDLLCLLCCRPWRGCLALLAHFCATATPT